MKYILFIWLITADGKTSFEHEFDTMQGCQEAQVFAIDDFEEKYGLDKKVAWTTMCAKDIGELPHMEIRRQVIRT